MARMESAHSGKMTKGKATKKLSLKKVRSLEGREIRGQLFRYTPELKVSKRLLGKEHQKKKII